MLKQLKGYRTLVFSALIAALGAAQAFDFTKVISNPKAVGYVLLSISVTIAVLRAVTTTPIGTK